MRLETGNLDTDQALLHNNSSLLLHDVAIVALQHFKVHLPLRRERRAQYGLQQPASLHRMCSRRHTCSVTRLAEELLSPGTRRKTWKRHHVQRVRDILGGRTYADEGLTLPLTPLLAVVGRTFVCESAAALPRAREVS
jgi:hypothetical protein